MCFLANLGKPTHIKQQKKEKIMEMNNQANCKWLISRTEENILGTYTNRYKSCQKFWITKITFKCDKLPDTHISTHKKWYQNKQIQQTNKNPGLQRRENHSGSGVVFICNLPAQHNNQQTSLQIPQTRVQLGR